MCAKEEGKITESNLFGKQFDFAWEHFRFHAEQRTRMFHFFLVTAALLLNAYSLLVGDGPYQQYAFLVLCIGGLVSTMFLSLDVRNTQLLDMSEALLRQIEDKWLYPISDPTWLIGEPGAEIRLGMLSREAILKRHLDDLCKSSRNRLWSWIRFNNVKHKLSIRFIQGLAIVMFWVCAFFTTPNEYLWVKFVEIALFAICLWWAIFAMQTPKHYKQWEEEAPKSR